MFYGRDSEQSGDTIRGASCTTISWRALWFHIRVLWRSGFPLRELGGHRARPHRSLVPGGRCFPHVLRIIRCLTIVPGHVQRSWRTSRHACASSSEYFARRTAALISARRLAPHPVRVQRRVLGDALLLVLERWTCLEHLPLGPGALTYRESLSPRAECLPLRAEALAFLEYPTPRIGTVQVLLRCVGSCLCSR
jgi:hypothetical protein